MPVHIVLDAQVNLALATGLRDYPNMPFEMRARFAIHFTDEALGFQGVFAQFENGQLEEETYCAYLNWFSALVATPGGACWCEETGRPVYVGKMVAAVDK